MGRIVLALFLLHVPWVPAVATDWFLDGESGAAFSVSNDVRIPRESGTRFSLTDELEADPKVFFRGRLSAVRGRHTVSLLAAPLRIRSAGALDRDLVFEGVRFPAETALDATYRFDSYRLTYRYAVYRSLKLRVGVGVTAKIRDAAVEVRGGSSSAQKLNTGFVPLINFNLQWRPSAGFIALLEGDALAAPQGRAEDVFAGIGLPVHPRVVIRVGYRFLEGGADVEEVYNFAFISFASLGVQLRL